MEDMLKDTWMIWSMLIIGVPLLALAAYGLWHNHQCDKYYETHKPESS